MERPTFTESQQRTYPELSEAEAITDLLKLMRSPECSMVALYRKSLTTRKAVFQRFWKRGEFSKADCLVVIAWEATPRDSVSFPEELWELSQDFETATRGRPTSGEKMVLALDLVYLRSCPNPYLHLLRDALVLKLRQQPNTSVKLRTLSKSISWSETTCKRIWTSFFNRAPPATQTDWWVRVARAEIGERALNRAAAAAFLSDVRKLRYASLGA